MIKRFIITIFFCLTLLASEGTFVVLPLPFYETYTGFGLILKALHTNLYKNLYVDSTGIATTQEQYVLLNSVGQKEVPNFENLFWALTLGGTHLNIKYYGRGNHTDLNDPANYNHKSYIFTPEVGVSFFKNLKAFLIYSRKRKRLGDFEDPGGRYMIFWKSLNSLNIHENRLGYGFSYKLVDSESRPMEGVSLSYRYMIASSRFMRNDYSFREAIFDFGFFIPLYNNLSHASRILYQRVSDSAPFYEHPTIRVRGIERNRHKDNITFVVQNEERLYISKTWALVPFWDFGRVMQDFSGIVFSDFHHGYGVGVRSIIKDTLVVRADIGFSKGKELAFVFNYGHTF